VFGFVAVWLYGSHLGSAEMHLRASAVTVMISGAAFLAGMLLGFLFGIPRTLQQEQPVQSATRSDAHDQERANAVSYRVNTNLEQISDWLTKILVGVGLTQLSHLPDRLWQLASYLARGIDGSEQAKAFTVVMILFFLVCGFLVGYLWTRLILAGEFQRADMLSLDNLQAEIRKTGKKVDELKKQAEYDANALSLVRRQLDPPPQVAPPTQDELDDALKKGSPAMLAQIFDTAYVQRRDNWQTNKPKMELTIPIFRALAACDTAQRFHRTYGQLGYALKDQSKPDWQEAEKELSRAISIRDSQGEAGWTWYEYNRAISRIMLDPQFNAGQPSTSEARASIVSDLRAVANWDWEFAQKDTRIGRWMAVNGITLRDLK
jgi:uncharacterized protein YneF (UPF0154 family)